MLHEVHELQKEGAVRTWRVGHPGPISSGPLVASELPDPRPGRGEVLLRVRVCGVCRTDLHLVEGDLKPRHPGTIPGHEVVGEVLECGEDAARFRPGERAGVAWLGRTCGSCRFCLRGQENLCLSPTFTGWDRDGGYAELITVAEDFAYRIPDIFPDEEAAPLLCSGIIGYRALLRAELPIGGRLGIYGFGASAHLATQIALSRGARVYVMTRSEEGRRLALQLGATFAGRAEDRPPDPLDSAILFAPAGGLVPMALRALDRGGTLAVAGIHLSDIPPLHYASDLFQERQLRSVTANTRADGEEFFRIAAEIPLRPTTVGYPFSAADKALRDLADDRITGAAVLHMGSEARLT
ncbi:MAG: alcohol dehydrogenase, propanol-preferring [Actinomycetota bacterium]|nr:alcohol dehydrogenase, propanol-preferring [Actinomycetota bacterium]